MVNDDLGTGVGGEAQQPSAPTQHGPSLTRALVMAAPGLVLAAVLTFIASFAICGISGCSGGGFGRSTDPGTTRGLLVAAGLAAAAPWAIYALWSKSLRLALAAGLLAIVVCLGAGWFIGSDVRGCPRSVDTATCSDESS